MKSIFLLIIILAQTSAKLFEGSCPFEQLKNISECVNNELFTLQNVSSNSNAYQVIARIEYERAQGISMFYTYQKQNLLAVISSQGIFSITCLSTNKSPVKSQLNFALKFENSDQCNVMKNIYIPLPGYLNFNEFKETTRKPQTYVTRKNEFLAIWGCDEMQFSTYDLAAWILLSDNSKIVVENQEMKTHLKYFLSLLSEVGLKFSEDDFKMTEFSGDQCEDDSKFIYAEVNNAVTDMKTKLKKLSLKSSEHKLFIALSIVMILIGFVGTYLLLSKFLTSRCRNSAVGNDDRIFNSQVLFVRAEERVVFNP